MHNISNLFYFGTTIYISISQPTDATCDNFYFLSIYSLYMFQAPIAPNWEFPTRQSHRQAATQKTGGCKCSGEDS
jgi:hypothetical protein